jgi:S-methylmethionine-dependent homocysteine/selenocysteine methylase
MVISGCLGPRGDGYRVADAMTEDEATDYHLSQIETFSQTEADLVSAFTIAYAEEAVGIARAARSVGMPVVVSFTVETDGRLPGGHTLKEAIEKVDEATDGTPAYYMINCAHPTHFKDALTVGEPWLDRIRAIRANASSRSHAELDGAEELDDGDPGEMAAHYVELKARLGNLNVLGGCCGTDLRHVGEICSAWKNHR